MYNLVTQLLNKRGIGISTPDIWHHSIRFTSNYIRIVALVKIANLRWNFHYRMETFIANNKRYVQLRCGEFAPERNKRKDSIYLGEYDTVRDALSINRYLLCDRARIWLFAYSETEEYTIDNKNRRILLKLGATGILRIKL